MNDIVHVPLGDRAYDVIVGAGVSKLLPEKLKDIASKQKTVVVITEDNVAKHHLASLQTALENSDYDVRPLILKAGEATKNFENLEKAVRFCLEHHVERSHAIIALGGGVIGDLTGFVASMIRRGCKFIQIPTTLLAQVDSSVGGKTAINTPDGKNLVGAFYQPSLVLADTDYLQTLSKRDYNAGYAEVLKYGLLGDKDFFIFLSQNQDQFDAYNPDYLRKIVTYSVQMKADIVVEDEKEHGRRALLNLGHTFGHAYEAEMGYSEKLLHGEAVALGMVHAFEYSAAQGLCTLEDAAFVCDVIKKAHLPTSLKDTLPNASSEILLKHMKQDKKVSDGSLTFILVKAIGDAFIQKDVEQNKIIRFLDII